jgi:hypothetical protein
MKDKHSKGSGFDQNDLYSLKREVEQLRTIVMHLLHCHANDAKLDLNLKAIRDSLHLRQDADASDVLDRLNRTQATVQGKVACPGCQSMVELRAGIHPRCSFCGMEFKAPTSETSPND